MNIGIIGLGRMGASLSLARSAMKSAHRVVGYNKNADRTRELAAEGLDPAFSLAELVRKLAPLLRDLAVPKGCCMPALPAPAT